MEEEEEAADSEADDNDLLPSGGLVETTPSNRRIFELDKLIGGN